MSEDTDSQSHVWLGSASGDSRSSVPARSSTRHGQSGHSQNARGRKVRGKTKVLLAVAALVALWILVVAVAKVISPNVSVDDRAAPEPTVDQPVVEEPVVDESVADGRAPHTTPDAQPAPDASEPDTDAEVDVDKGREVTAQAAHLQDHLARLSSTALAVYRSDEGIVVIDLAQGTTETLPLTDVASTAEPGLFVLRTGGASFTIDPTTLAVAQVDDSSLVLTQARDGSTYFVAEQMVGRDAPLVEVHTADEYSFYLLPAGYSLLPFDGLGLVASSATEGGATLIAGPERFTTLSSHRVLDGNAHAIVERVCDEPTVCSLIVTDLVSGDLWTVPKLFAEDADQYMLSPDGRSLLRYQRDGFAQVLIAETEAAAWVIGAGMESPAWGPNSDFVVWLDQVDEPKLGVLFPDESDWMTIDLADLGAPAPSSPEIIVFSR